MAANWRNRCIDSLFYLLLMNCATGRMCFLMFMTASVNNRNCIWTQLSKQRNLVYHEHSIIVELMSSMHRLLTSIKTALSILTKSLNWSKPNVGHASRKESHHSASNTVSAYASVKNLDIAYLQVIGAKSAVEEEQPIVSKLTRMLQIVLLTATSNGAPERLVSR